MKMQTLGGTITQTSNTSLNLYLIVEETLAVKQRNLIGLTMPPTTHSHVH
jgi:hypothetical protein